MKTNKFKEFFKNSKVRKTFKIIGAVFETIIICLVVLITISAIISNKKNGIAVTPLSKTMLLRVQDTGSMEPFLYGGDLVVARAPKKDEKYEVNEIVAFEYRSNGRSIIVIHRIIEIKENDEGVQYQVITHGDNNPEGKNETIYISNIKGVYKSHIKGLGGVFDIIKDKTVFFCVVIIPLILLFAWNLYSFIVVLKKAKLKKQIDTLSEGGEISEEIKQKALAEYLAKKKKEEEEQNAKGETGEERK